MRFALQFDFVFIIKSWGERTVSPEGVLSTRRGKSWKWTGVKGWRNWDLGKKGNSLGVKNGSPSGLSGGRG